MLYAVKFFQAAPNDEPFKAGGVPLDWPWKQLSITENQKEEYLSHGWTIFTPEEYRQYLDDRQPKFDLWWANREAARYQSRLRVLDLVQDAFSNYHPAKIDFTIHLKPNVVLNKMVKMLKNGRPEKAEYFYGSEKICEIKFEFVVNEQNFVTERKELLGYVQGDGDVPAYYLIRHKIYDMSNFADKAEVVEERSYARQYIMKEIKSVINDVLGLYYIVMAAPEVRKTPQELWTMAGNFWTLYSSAIDSWYNTATWELKHMIETDTSVEFLNLIVPPQISQDAEPKTVRQYIIDRITY